MAAADGTIYSFVVDAEPRFAYEGFQLARSLVRQGAPARAIHAQCTAGVPRGVREIFGELGCTVHELTPFGDGRYCNKLAQLENLAPAAFACAVLLDTDMIALGDVRAFLSRDAVCAKIVDLPNPPCETLDAIAFAAGVAPRAAACATDAGIGTTYAGNCNGGLYGVPRALAGRLSRAWRARAAWLLERPGLVPAPFTKHIDQISFWLALHDEELPFEPLASNANYYAHFAGEHVYFDSARDVALLHYHPSTLNMLGLIDPPSGLDARTRGAVDAANRALADAFDCRVLPAAHVADAALAQR